MLLAFTALLTMEIHKQLPTQAIVLVPLLVQASCGFPVSFLHEVVLVLTPQAQCFGAPGIISVPCLGGALKELVAKTAVLEGLSSCFEIGSVCVITSFEPWNVLRARNSHGSRAVFARARI